jgi:hypothetical protein
MLLLYHSEGRNICEMVLHECYVNDLHNTTCSGMLGHHIDLDFNGSHINSVDAKRCKLNDDNTMYMWHCCLGHISVKRMKELHKDGLLESLDFDSLNRCEPCLMGKMNKTPFTCFVERVTNLLPRLEPFSRRSFSLKG